MSRGKPGYSGGVECNEPAFMWHILLFMIILYGVILFGSLLGFLPFKSKTDDHNTPVETGKISVVSTAHAHSTPDMPRLHRIVENAKTKRCPEYYAVIGRLGGPPKVRIVATNYSRIPQECRDQINDYELKVMDRWCEQRQRDKQ